MPSSSSTAQSRRKTLPGPSSAWAAAAKPWAILLPSTAWGREVGGRAAARLDAGLTGDAIDLEVSRVASTGEAQLLAWKPAFGGRLVAAIYCSSPIQMATVRAGVLPTPSPPRLDNVDACNDHPHGGTPRARAGHGVGARRRPRRAGHRGRGDRRRCRRASRRVRRHRAAAPGARRRAGGDAQGDGQGLAAAGPSGRHHRAEHRAAPLRGRRVVRQVQPHGGRSGRGHRPRRSTPTPTPSCGITPTSASSATGARFCPCWWPD